MLGQAGGLPIRVASKSVRSLPVLRRIFALDERFRGILSFTLPEALMLADEGFDEIFVGYPTTDRARSRSSRRSRRSARTRTPR